MPFYNNFEIDYNVVKRLQVCKLNAILKHHKIAAMVNSALFALAITPLLLLLFFLANVLPFDHAFFSSVAGVYAIGHVLVWGDVVGISLGRSLSYIREAPGNVAVLVQMEFWGVVGLGWW